MGSFTRNRNTRSLNQNLFSRLLKHDRQIKQTAFHDPSLRIHHEKNLSPADRIDSSGRQNAASHRNSLRNNFSVNIEKLVLIRSDGGICVIVLATLRNQYDYRIRSGAPHVCEIAATAPAGNDRISSMFRFTIQQPLSNPAKLGPLVAWLQKH